MKKLDRTHNLFNIMTMQFNSKFVKDGSIYLLRGDKNGLERGITSSYYRKGNTLASTKISPKEMAFSHVLNGNTAFISATTNYMVAASFSQKKCIYLIKIPLKDICIEHNSFTIELAEEEYLIPDIIYPNEIIKVFRFDELNNIYLYMKNNLGLSLMPEDLGVSEDELKHVNYGRIRQMMEFNNGGMCFDPILRTIQKSIEKGSKK